MKVCKFCCCKQEHPVLSKIDSFAVRRLPTSTEAEVASVMSFDFAAKVIAPSTTIAY